MICPFVKKEKHLLLTQDLQKMAPLLEEEDYVVVERDLLLLREFNIEK